MMRCTHCWAWKNEEDFNWRIKGIKRWGICRECQKKQKVEWYEEHKEDKRLAKNQRTRDQRDVARQYVYDYLSTHPCVDCGEADPRVLEFDHLGDKDKTIAEMIRDGASLSRLNHEIAKCEVRCANCHRRKTSDKGGWFRSKKRD